MKYEPMDLGDIVEKETVRRREEFALTVERLCPR